MGASFLVVGSVIIGRREEEKDLVAASSGSTNAATPRQELHEHDDKYMEKPKASIHVAYGLADKSKTELLARTLIGE